MSLSEALVRLIVLCQMFASEVPRWLQFTCGPSDDGNDAAQEAGWVLGIPIVGGSAGESWPPLNRSLY